MTAITLAQAQANLTLALAKIPTAGQTVRHGDKAITYPPLETVMTEVNYWTALLDQINAAADGKNRRVAYAEWNNV